MILVTLDNQSTKNKVTKICKGGFFSDSAIKFFRSPNIKKKKNIPKNYPELEI